MSDIAFATLTKQAISLPYEERKELFDTIRITIQNVEPKQRKRLDFDSYVVPCERANFADEYIVGLRSNDRVCVCL